MSNTGTNQGQGTQEEQDKKKKLEQDSRGGQDAKNQGMDSGTKTQNN